MSGLEFLRAIIDGRIPQAPMCQTLQFWLVEAGEGVAVFEGESSAALLNPMGSVHGGWALTLLDSAAGSAGHSTLEPGSAYATLETRGHMTRAITPTTGRVRAEARVVTRGRRVIVTEATLGSGEGKILAHGTSTLLVVPVRAR